MSELPDAFSLAPRPTAERPLLGQTVLVVEDSRVAGEALRLMCLKSGARIRRADSLRAAGRHLTTYRPTVAIVDLGLPDGSGLDLIAELAGRRPRVPVLLAMSGDAGAGAAALAAGADGFLDKPVGPLAAFQAAILAQLPQSAAALPLRAVSDEPPEPADPQALHDDLTLAAELLDARAGEATLAYLGGFVAGIGRCTGDRGLTAAAERLRKLHAGDQAAAQAQVLAALLQDRLAPRPPAA